MLENLKSKIENLADKADDFAEDHPLVAGSVFFVAIMAVSMPLCVLAYKYTGRIQGKAIAKELAEAGVKLGYNHR